MISKKLLIAILLLTVVVSCKEKTIDPANDTEVNSWILGQMQYWYYWNDKIPANPNMSLTPANFFSSILNKYDATTNPTGDRFSWLDESADNLQSSLNGKTTTPGMDYKLYYYPAGSKNIVGIVIYTIPNSPATKAGFKRGDIFTQINGQKLIEANYKDLIKLRGTIVYGMGKMDDAGVITDSDVTRQVVTASLQENPVYFDTVFQYNTHKIAYLVYHQFVPGPDSVSGSKAYDQQLEATFAKFKSSQVNELVLDLRYNGGGYVSSATVLGSLIGKGTPNDVFYYKEYNKTVTPILEKKYGASFFYEKFLSKSQNIGANLNSVYILTSGSSASASELVINGLKAVMPVQVIGGKTYGKNVGSITLTGKDKGINLGLQPIVSKTFNGKHESDYSGGFVPNVQVSEGLRLYRYGDPRDPLLGAALEQIVGSPVTRRSPNRALESPNSVEIGSTLSNKTGGNNMFFTPTER